MNNRQTAQLEFDARDDNIVVGSELNLPLPLDLLVDVDNLKKLGSKC